MDLAKKKAVPGVLVNIQVSNINNFGVLRNSGCVNAIVFLLFENFLSLLTPIASQNAAYLASKKGLDIVDAVSSALKNASFDKQQVLVQSDDSSVLSKFKDNPSYKRVMFLSEIIGNVPSKTAEEIKKYAEAVNIPKNSVIEVYSSYLYRLTNVVKELKNANIKVFVRTLKNEYTSLAFDYWSDPNIEIATYIQTAMVDGIVTDFPATTSRFVSKSFQTQCLSSSKQNKADNNFTYHESSLSISIIVIHK